MESGWFKGVIRDSLPVPVIEASILTFGLTLPFQMDGIDPDNDLGWQADLELGNNKVF